MMKKNRKFVAVVGILLMLLVTSGCQTTTKSLGGSMTIKLPPDQKLETIDWEDDSLWYLTRPMREGEEPETHKLQQSSEFGVFEGTVTIIESKGEEDGEE